eukprot:COSAG01_NODE_5080_length_4501_cov_8.855293_4_plen_75_part_00
MLIVIRVLRHTADTTPLSQLMASHLRREAARRCSTVSASQYRAPSPSGPPSVTGVGAGLVSHRLQLVPAQLELI